jgi:hypothetical protein
LIASLDFVAIPSRDADRSAQFFGETLDTGVCKMAFFEDPDDKNLMLHQRYAPR